MNTDRICPECRRPLPEHAPQGLCPECLLKRGLGSEVEIGTSTETPGREKPAGGDRPPFSVEELRPFFPQLEVLAFIGRGGMGAVYQARQKQLGRVVALKILPPEVGADPAFAERFTREARALARLSHPNIVTIHDFGQTDGLFFLVMEYVDGVNLRQLLQAGRVSPREALAIVPQICDALQYAHDQGIVHRDIKPENLLLDRLGRVKVADFGLAKLMGASTEPPVGQASGSGDVSLTESGQVMGTPHYMAPEQREHPEAVDHRADIYSLGVVFYQLLTGELPSKPIEAPSRRVLVDVRLDEVVLRALEKTPERRYQTAAEFRTQVETVSQRPSMPDPVPPLASPPVWARTPWQIWVTIALLGLEGVGNLLSIPQQPQALYWLLAKCLFVTGLLLRWRPVFILMLAVTAVHVVYFLPSAPVAAGLNALLLALVGSTFPYYFRRQPAAEVRADRPQEPGSAEPPPRRLPMFASVLNLAWLLLPPACCVVFLLAGHRWMGLDLDPEELFYAGVLGLPTSSVLGLLLAWGWRLALSSFGLELVKERTPRERPWLAPTVAGFVFLTLSQLLGGGTLVMIPLMLKESHWNPGPHEIAGTVLFVGGATLTGLAATLLGCVALRRARRASAGPRPVWSALGLLWFWPAMLLAVAASIPSVSHDRQIRWRQELIEKEQDANRAEKAARILEESLPKLRSGDPDQRMHAALRIMSQGRWAEPAVPDLLRALEDESYRVRLLAAATLGYIGEPAGPDASQALQRALGDSNEYVRHQASVALASVDRTTTANLAMLIDRLTIGPADDPHGIWPIQRREAAEALGRMGQRARPALPLLRMLQGQPEGIGDAARKAVILIEQGGPGSSLPRDANLGEAIRKLIGAKPSKGLEKVPDTPRPATEKESRRRAEKAATVRAQPPHRVNAESAPPPRQVVTEWLRRVKANAPDVWDVTTRSRDVGWDSEFPKQQEYDRIRPRHQIGNDEQAMVVSGPFRNNWGEINTCYAMLLCKDGRWLVDKNGRDTPEAVLGLMRGFAMHPGVKFDVTTEELVGHWLGPCVEFSLSADGSGARLLDGPEGPLPKPKPLRWEVNGAALTLREAEESQKLEITWVEDDAFHFRYPNGDSRVVSRKKETKTLPRADGVLPKPPAGGGSPPKSPGKSADATPSAVVAENGGDSAMDREPWGPAVEGLGARLRAVKSDPAASEMPVLAADLRNRGKRDLLDVVEGQANWQLEVDGKWYVWPPILQGGRRVPLGLDAVVRGVRLAVSPIWQEAQPKDLDGTSAGGAVAVERPMIQLVPGKHTIRAACMVWPRHANTGPSLRVVSNSVELDLPPRRYPSWPARPELAQAVVDLYQQCSHLEQAAPNKNGQILSSVGELQAAAGRLAKLAPGTPPEILAESLLLRLTSLETTLKMGGKPSQEAIAVVIRPARDLVAIVGGERGPQPADFGIDVDDPDLALARMYDGECNRGIRTVADQRMAERHYLAYIARTADSTTKARAWVQVGALYGTTYQKEQGEKPDYPKARRCFAEALKLEPQRIGHATLRARTMEVGPDLTPDQRMRIRVRTIKWLKGIDEPTLRREWLPDEKRDRPTDQDIRAFLSLVANVLLAEETNVVGDASSAADPRTNLKWVIAELPGGAAAAAAQRRLDALGK